MTQPRNTDLRNFPLGFFYIDSAEVFSQMLEDAINNLRKFW